MKPSREEEGATMVWDKSPNYTTPEAGFPPGQAAGISTVRTIND